MTPVPTPATPGPVDVATVRFIADAFQNSRYGGLAEFLTAALAALPQPQQDDPAPVREWGVRHGDDCTLGANRIERSYHFVSPSRLIESQEEAEQQARHEYCSAVAVSCVFGGVWEPVEGSDFGALVAGVSRRAAEAKFGQPVEQEEATDERSELANVIWETSRADEGTISATGANIIADKLLASGYSNAELEKVKRGAKTLGETIDKQLQAVLDVTGMHHLIGADGDGDWGAVWDHLWSMKAAPEPDRFSVAEIEAAWDKLPKRHNAPVRDKHAGKGLSETDAWRRGYAAAMDSASALLLDALRAGREES